LNQQIEKLLSNPQVADWFSSNWKYGMKFTRSCQREQNIDDRLLLKDKKAVVIDFKTGKPKKDDQKQIGDIAAANQMGFSSEGYLYIY